MQTERQMDQQWVEQDREEHIRRTEPSRARTFADRPLPWRQLGPKPKLPLVDRVLLDVTLLLLGVVFAVVIALVFEVLPKWVQPWLG